MRVGWPNWGSRGLHKGGGNWKLSKIPQKRGGETKILKGGKLGQGVGDLKRELWVSEVVPREWLKVK